MNSDIHAFTPFRVFCIVSGIILYDAIAFKSEDVSREFVEKKSVMRGNQKYSVVCAQEIFQQIKCLNVKVIGGLVKNEKIRTLKQNEKEIESSFFTATEFPEFVMLDCRREVKMGQELRDTHFATVNVDHFGIFLYDFKNRLVVIKL